jgi:hypothetical protein
MCAHGDPIGLGNKSVMADGDVLQTCRGRASASGSRTYRAGCQSEADSGVIMFTDEFQTAAAVPTISSSNWTDNPLNAGESYEEFTECARIWGGK